MTAESGPENRTKRSVRRSLIEMLGWWARAVVLGDRQHQRLGREGARGESVAGHRRTEHAEVEGPLVQPVDLRGGEQVGVDLEGHAGERTLDGARHPGQLGVGRAAGEGDADEALPAGGDASYAAHAGLDRLQDARHLELEELAGGREPHLAGGPDEERGAELGLELADRLRQGGLRHVEAVGRAPEVAGLGHRGEVAQVSQLHGSSSVRLDGDDAHVVVDSR